MLSLITGVGAKGQVGEAVAAGLASRGDIVLLVSRDADEVGARAAELVAVGRRAHGYGCDLSSADEVAALAIRIRTEHGDRLDAMVNLAGGWSSSGPIGESDPAALQRMFAINFTTAYLTTRAFFPLVAQARGSIVYFASESVLEGARTSGVAGYAAAKSAVVALMRSVADEGRSAGVRANALAPASIRTGTNQASMSANTRYVEREEVASAVAFLTSEAASAISSQVIRLRPSS